MTIPLHIQEGNAGPWQTWFAWHPVRLPCGCVAWLRMVMRRRFHCAAWFMSGNLWFWEYSNRVRCPEKTNAASCNQNGETSGAVTTTRQEPHAEEKA